CSACGAPMHFVNKQKGGGRSLRNALICANAERGTCESRHNFIYQPFEADLIGLLAEADLTGLVEKPKADPVHSELDQLGVKIVRLTTKRDRLIDIMGDEENDPDLDQKIKQLGTELKELRATQKQLTEQSRQTHAEAGRDRQEQIRELM